MCVGLVADSLVWFKAIGFPGTWENLEMSENCRIAIYRSGKVMEIPIMNRHFF